MSCYSTLKKSTRNFLLAHGLLNAQYLLGLLDFHSPRATGRVEMSNPAYYFCLKLKQIKEQESWFLVDFFCFSSHREQKKSFMLYLSEFSFLEQLISHFFEFKLSCHEINPQLCFFQVNKLVCQSWAILERFQVSTWNRHLRPFSTVPFNWVCYMPCITLFSVHLNS